MIYRVKNLDPVEFMGRTGISVGPGGSIKVGTAFRPAADIPENWFVGVNNLVGPLNDGQKVPVELKVTIGQGTMYWWDVPTGEKGSFDQDNPVLRDLTHVSGAQDDMGNRLYIRGSGPY